MSPWFFDNLISESALSYAIHRGARKCVERFIHNCECLSAREVMAAIGVDDVALLKLADRGFPAISCTADSMVWSPVAPAAHPQSKAPLYHSHVVFDWLLTGKADASELLL
jgi:hypothetical protein